VAGIFGVAAAAGCVAITAGACTVALPALMTQLAAAAGTGATSAAATATAAGAGAAIKGAKIALKGINYLNQHHSGSDDLIVKIGGQTVIPSSSWKSCNYNRARTACKISSQQTLTGSVSRTFTTKAKVQLVEYDKGGFFGSNSDDLGNVIIPAKNVGSKDGTQVVIKSTKEGTLYTLTYTVQLGKGIKGSRPKYLHCGTVRCNQCDAPGKHTCSNNAGLTETKTRKI